MRTRILSVAIATSLTACGGGDDKNETGPMSAADVARALGREDAARQDRRVDQGPGTAEAQGINCGPVNAQQPQGMDMVGIWIGMPADQAFARIACSNTALRVEFSNEGGFDVPPPPNGGQMRTGIEARSENERISAVLIGMPGQERVAYISRMVRYANGGQPAFDAFIQQFQRKYGQMATSYNASDGIVFGTVRAPDGRSLMTEADQSAFSACLPTPFGPSVSGDCGASLRVHLIPAGHNTPLVGQMTASMTDGALAMRMIEDYRSVAGAAQQQRQQQELDAARQRAPGL